MQAKLSQARQQLIAERARSMRVALTSSEFALWQAINCQQLGAAFKRQYPLGNYIVDFAAPSVKLAI